jgi:hypothetical protein
LGGNSISIPMSAMSESLKKRLSESPATTDCAKRATGSCTMSVGVIHVVLRARRA